MSTNIPNEELLIFKKLSNNFKVVFDVGCRDDLDYYEINKDIQYHLFEPHIPAINSIKEKIDKLKNPNIKLNEYGLSDKVEDNCVYYSNVESFTKHWYLPSTNKGEKYSLKKLDDYVTDNKIDLIDFLKIDVEGLDYKVILGGLKTIKDNNKVSYIQIEYSGNIKQYVDLLDNFNFYLMIEPRLLMAINKLNKNKKNFNESLIKLSESVIDFIDNIISPTGAGGNILGINKNISSNIDDLIFKII